MVLIINQSITGIILPLPYQLSGIDDVPAELIQAGGEIQVLCSEIHNSLILFGIKKNCLSS
jgi:hypothetical protein